MPRKLPTPKYSLRSHLMVVIGATFLLCMGVILFFFPILNRSLGELLEASIAKMRTDKEVEATTIARLLVLEFSQLGDLRTVKPGPDNDADQRLKNLIWQKVTFNEMIQGIELIQAPGDDQGRYLTYLFYRREDPELKPMGGPEKTVKQFKDKEKELLDSINARQTTDEISLQAVNQGPKEEGQMLLRYLPLHVLAPEEGALYWGVAKIGIDNSGLTQLLAMQNQEQDRLRQAIWRGIIISLGLSGLLVVSLLFFWARSLTEPLGILSVVARDFQAAKARHYRLWLENLKRVDHRGQVEVADLKETLVRLGEAVPRLGERLFAKEHQACLSRLAGRALPALTGSRRTQLPAFWADWQVMAVTLEEDWQIFDLTPTLASAWRMVTLGLPATVSAAAELKSLPPVWGSRSYLGQGILALLEYAGGQLPDDGRLALTAASLPAGGLQVVVTASHPTLSPQECQELLHPLDAANHFRGDLGPALAAAIASQHGGGLQVQPAQPQGLLFTLTLPPAPPDHGQSEPFLKGG